MIQLLPSTPLDYVHRMQVCALIQCPQLSLLTTAISALSRYIVGEDLYVPPRNAAELDYIL
jgi:hypothetical protein